MIKRKWVAGAATGVAFVLFFIPELALTLGGNAFGAGFFVGSALVCGLLAAGVGAIVYAVYRWKAAFVEYKPTPAFYKVVGIPTAAYSVLIFAVCFFAAKSTDITASERAVAQQQIAQQRAKAASDAAERARIAALPPEERQALADAATVAGAHRLVDVQTNADAKSQARGTDWESTRTSLTSIKKASPQYVDAQTLLAAMSADDKKLSDGRRQLADDAKRLAAAQEPLEIAARKEYAKKLEQQFLEQRMDTTVTATGTKATTLSIKWVLASRVSAHDLANAGLVDQAKSLGFKSVVFFNGFESELAERWVWDLTKHN